MQVQTLSKYPANKRVSVKRIGGTKKDVEIKVLSEMEVEKNTNVLCKLSENVGVSESACDPKLKLQVYKQIVSTKQADVKTLAHSLDRIMGSNDEGDEIISRRKSGKVSCRDERSSSKGCKEATEVDKVNRALMEDGSSSLHCSNKKERTFTEKNVLAKDDHKETKGNKPEEIRSKRSNRISSKLLRNKEKLKNKESLSKLGDVSEPQLVKTKSNRFSNLMSPSKKPVNKTDKSSSTAVIKSDNSSKLAEITSIKGNQTRPKEKNLDVPKRKFSVSYTASTRVTKRRTLPSFKKHKFARTFTSRSKHSIVAADGKPGRFGGDDVLQAQPDFEFISEELSFLNAESGKLATQIYKSDKEKRMDRKRKGIFIRNMLKKKKLMTKKYRKPEKLEKKCEPQLSDSSNSSDLELEIDSGSDFEFEMDRRLEENARKNNLTVMNVKSILHTVITNEHVVAMMNNTLKSAGEVDGELTEAVYEPKMTRSKIKEVLEKSEGVTPWLLPPIKSSSESQVSILDIPFNEDEEDDDYNPDKDALADIESDDDLESLNSSLVSSPLKKSPSSKMGDKLNTSLIDDDDKKDNESEETIARRTRSKLPLHDMSLTELEANFVAPDITEDMYDTECNDKNWQDFLNSLTRPEYVEDPTETFDDEANDPEYNYLAEAEQECLDDEDFRDDRMVRVSKKELHSLLDELFNDDGNEEEEAVIPPAPLVNTDVNAYGNPPNLNIMVTTEQAAILREQMKQHIQLLSQTVLLTLNRDEYIAEHSNAYQLLNEMHRFGHNSLAGEHSTFRVCNLDSSVQLIEKHKDEDFYENCNSKALPIPLQRIFSENSCFLYPEHLPQVNMRPKNLQKDKCTFFPSQDFLLALGFEQFSHFPPYMMCKCIRQLLVPCKTEKQIRTRIKNMRSKRAKDNPIKCVQLTKKLPEDFPHAVLSGVQDMVAPKDRSCHPSVPAWLKKYITPPSKKKSSSPSRIQSTSGSDEKKTEQKIEMKVGKKEDLEILFPDTRVKSLPPVVVVPTDIRPVPAVTVNHSCSSLIAPTIVFSSPTTVSVSPECVVQQPTVTTTPPPKSSPQLSDSSNPVVVVTSSINAITTVATQILSTSPMASASNPQFISEALAKQKELQKTPTKNLVPVFKPFHKFSPSMYKPLAPKPLQISPSTHRHVSPLLEKKTKKKRNSPRKQELQQKARLICPKEFVVKPFQKASPKVSSPSSMYKPLAPKPLQISPPGFRQVSPLLEKKKRNSPRRQELQQKARLICPKGLVIKPHFSPTNRAAYGLRKRATRSPRMARNGEPRTILPMKASPSSGTASVCCNLNFDRLEKVPNMSKGSSPLNSNVFCSTRSGGSGRKTVNHSVPNSATKGNWQNSKLSDKRSSGSSSAGGTGGGSGSNATNQQDEASSLQNGDSHIADLMAASSTINSNLKRSKDTRTKAQKRNDIKLAMLAPNLIEKDPRRDHRDTIFAQAYLTKVKKTLKNDMDRYEKFLRILFEFGRSDHSPVVLYKSLSYLLSDYPALIHDLAGFLSPELALQCGCYNTTMDFLKARNFLRKIEIIFEKHPSQYQKVLRIFAEWQQRSLHKEKELYDMLLPMFKGQDQLLAEFSGLFGFHSPPESHAEDFEEVVLDGTDPEFTSKLTGFEDVELSDEANSYGLPGCPCHCHEDKDNEQTENQGKKKKKIQKKQTHCTLCGLTVKDGKLYFKMPGKWKPVRAMISKSFYVCSPEKESEPVEPDLLLGNLKSIIEQPPSNSDSHLTEESSTRDQPKSIPSPSPPPLPPPTPVTPSSSQDNVKTFMINKPFEQKSLIPLKEFLNSSIKGSNAIKDVKFWQNSTGITLLEPGTTTHSLVPSLVTRTPIEMNPALCKSIVIPPAGTEIQHGQHTGSVVIHQVTETGSEIRSGTHTNMITPHITVKEIQPCTDSNTESSQSTAMVTEISSGSSSDILAKAWEQAGQTPAEGTELDDNLMQELLQIPVNENLEEVSESSSKVQIAGQVAAPPAVGPSMPTDFLLPSTSEDLPPSQSPGTTNLNTVPPSASTIMLPPLTLNSSGVTMLPLTLIPQAADGSHVQTVNINNQLAVGRQIVHGYPHHQNGINLRNVISKGRTRLSPKGRKEATINSILNMAIGKKNQQIVAAPVVVNNNTSSPKSFTAVKLQCAPATIEKWTKLMDKLILDTTKDHGANSQVFEFLSTKIQGRTPEEIKTRYQQLLQYLEQLKQ